MSDGRYLQNIMVWSWTRKIDGSPLGESLVAQSGYKGGSSGDISGGEIEGSKLGNSSTDSCSSSEISAGKGDGNL